MKVSTPSYAYGIVPKPLPTQTPQFAGRFSISKEKMKEGGVGAGGVLGAALILKLVGIPTGLMGSGMASGAVGLGYWGLYKILNTLPKTAGKEGQEEEKSEGKVVAAVKSFVSPINLAKLAWKGGARLTGAVNYLTSLGKKTKAEAKEEPAADAKPAETPPAEAKTPASKAVDDDPMAEIRKQFIGGGTLAERLAADIKEAAQGADAPAPEKPSEKPEEKVETAEELLARLKREIGGQNNNTAQ